MSTSSSTDFVVTKRQLIERALRMVGGLRSGASAESSAMTDCSLVLNSILRELDLKRLGWWVRKQGSLTTVAGQIEYTSVHGLPTDILRLEPSGGFYTISASQHDPVEVIGPTEYDKISDKTTTGDVRKIMLSDDSAIASRTLTVYPSPQSAKVLKFRYRRSLFDFDADADDADFPGAWFSTLAYLLASEIGEEYTQDKDKIERLNLIAEKKVKEIKAMSTKSTSNPKEKNHEYY